MNTRAERSQSSGILYIIIIVAILTYLLPWSAASSASLTLNAYDLAEWVSLHPAQRLTSPPLLSPLLLRLQLTILTLLLAATNARTPWRRLAAVGIILLSIAQLPPPEYIRDIGNLNYRQQFFLALTSLLVGLALLRIRLARVKTLVIAALPLAGVVTTVAGVAAANDVIAELQPNAQIGLGPWLYAASMLAILLLAALNRLRQTQFSS